jgi:hypothetical protein
MERKSFLLRIDPALWAELEAWAQDELRSVNGQIEYLLRQAVQKRKRNKPRQAALPPGLPRWNPNVPSNAFCLLSPHSVFCGL